MSLDPTRLPDIYDSRFGYQDELAYTRTEPAQPAKREPEADVLPDALASSLPFDLYTHQTEGLRCLADGENVTVATATASGKTYVYALDIARRHLENPDSTALLLYPTTALTRDQHDSITSLLNETLGLDIQIDIYDGRTSDGRKPKIRDEADVVLSNFAGLNLYLSHHPKWARFFRNLSLVAIDESHQYTGVHGMHVAWILRRIKRIVRQYGGDPQYVLTTATIGNPIEHGHTLTGEDVSLVDNDGSAQGEREIIFWQPPFDPVGPDPDDTDNAPSTSFVSNELTAILAGEGVQTLQFSDSRTMTELGERRVGSLAKAGVTAQAYHAGLGSTTRRDVEKRLREGRIDAVIGTSALELGLDVGELDGVVLEGYPGTRQSFWQRLGRAGRGTEKALGVFVADYTGLDQYIVRNPEYIFDENVENAVIDLANNKVYSQHILCAANEEPLTWEDAPDLGGEDRLERVVEMWKTAGLLAGSLDTGVRFTRATRPAEDVDLYTTGEDASFDVRLAGVDDDFEHPNIEQVRAYRDYHEGAVVLHNGNDYIVEELNEDTKKPYVVLSEQANLDHYTRTTRNVEVNDLEETESVDLGTFTLHRGSANVRTHFHTYEERRIKDNETLDRYPTNVPSVTMQTHVLWIEPSDEIGRDILREFADETQLEGLDTEDEGLPFALNLGVVDEFSGGNGVEIDIYLGGLHAVEHAMIGTAPLSMMMDKRDLGGLSTLNHPETETTGALFIYDGVPGGVGFSHTMFERLELLVETTRELIKGCECDSVTGCPACTMDENCGDDNEPLHNPAAVELLTRLREELGDVR